MDLVLRFPPDLIKRYKQEKAKKVALPPQAANTLTLRLKSPTLQLINPQSTKVAQQTCSSLGKRKAFSPLSGDQKPIRRVRFTDLGEENTSPRPLINKEGIKSCLKKTPIFEENTQETLTYDSIEDLFKGPMPKWGHTLNNLTCFLNSSLEDGTPRFSPCLDSQGNKAWRAFVKTELGGLDDYLDIKVEQALVDGEGKELFYSETFTEKDIGDRSLYLKAWICNDDEKGGYHQEDKEAVFIIRIQDNNVAELCHLKALAPFSGNHLYAQAQRFVDALMIKDYFLHDASKKEFYSVFSKNKKEPVNLRHILPLATGKTWYESKGMKVVDFFNKQLQYGRQYRSQDSSLYKKAWIYLRQCRVHQIEQWLHQEIPSTQKDPHFSLSDMAHKYGFNPQDCSLATLTTHLYTELRKNPECHSLQKDLSQLYVGYLTEYHSCLSKRFSESPKAALKLPLEARVYFLALDVVWNTIIFKRENTQEKEELEGCYNDSSSPIALEVDSFFSDTYCLEQILKGTKKEKAQANISSIAQSLFNKKIITNAKELILAKRLLNPEGSVDIFGEPF